MVNRFDRIVIAVPDLCAAMAEYRQLLGVPGLERASGTSSCVWFFLPNTVIELRPSSGDTAQIRSIVFSADSASGNDEPVVNRRGLDIRLCNGVSTSEQRAGRPDNAVADIRVDHLVLRTVSADDCIELFSRELGLRLALDQNVPEWGGRMLFFRAGKLTLEVIESQRERPTEDSFWGIAYHCADLEKTVARLAAQGVALSEIRTGRKQGSVVATVKSHCLGIPTLLVAAH